MRNVLKPIFQFMGFFFVRFLVFQIWSILYSTVNRGHSDIQSQKFSMLGRLGPPKPHFFCGALRIFWNKKKIWPLMRGRGVWGVCNLHVVNQDRTQNLFIRIIFNIYIIHIIYLYVFIPVYEDRQKLIYNFIYILYIYLYINNI